MLHDDIAEFRSLHAAASRSGRLTSEQFERYAALSDELHQRVLVAQHELAGARLHPRTAIRARRALRVELSWAGEAVRTLTVDVGAGGFAALLAAAPPRNSTVRARLFLSHADSVVLGARVAGARERRGTARVAFAFTELDDPERLRLQRFLLDDALSHVR